jgi:hypothetical protein
MENQQERNLADMNWLAAAWESEGWFSILGQRRKRRRKVWLGERDLGMVYNCVAAIKNTDPLFVKEVTDILSRNGLAYYISIDNSGKRKDGTPAKKQMSVIIAGTKRVQRFLNVIIKYLRTKIDRAMKLKEFVDFRLSKPYSYPYTLHEFNLFNELREMNGNKPMLDLSSTTNMPKTVMSS